MRRLTLILSDLYLPADAVRESFPTMLDLPALEWLLRFAPPPRRIGDWRSWLACELGADDIADWPVAHVCALAAAATPAGTWMATPVALEARIDHVRLQDRGLLRLPQEHQQALQHEFAQVFPDLTLSGATSGGLLLGGGPAADIVTQDPARLLDADIRQALPTGSGAAGELRRLAAEIEMWLHSSAINAERVRAGRKKVAALWLWGGGVARGATGAPRPGAAAFRLFGEDPFIRALHAILGSGPGDMPRTFEDLRVDAPVFVELSPMSGMRAHALPELERHWFAPARTALSSGALDSFRLVANDRVFDVPRKAGWKFWRRRRRWLESLA